MALSKASKTTREVFKLAQKKTEKDLKSKEIVKTIVTYPKGLRKKTMSKNLKIEYAKKGLPMDDFSPMTSVNKKSKKRKKSSIVAATKKKTAAKKPAVKKVAAKKPAVKKAATKKPMAKKAAAKKPVTAKMATKKRTTAKKKTTSPRKRKTGFIASIKKIFS